MNHQKIREAIDQLTDAQAMQFAEHLCAVIEREVGGLKASELISDGAYFKLLINSTDSQRAEALGLTLCKQEEA